MLQHHTLVPMNHEVIKQKEKLLPGSGLLLGGKGI